MDGVLYFLFHTTIGKYLPYLPNEIRYTIYNHIRENYIRLNVYNLVVYLKIL